MLDEREQIGGNNPPDPLDEALSPYGDFITEAEAWLDGQTVTTEAQMNAVDAISRQIKAAEKAVKEAEESEAKPVYDQWKATKARFAPTIDDLCRIKKGLAALVNDFKKRLAEEKAEAERRARAEAERKAREAAEAARLANAADIEAQRAAAEAQREAELAQAQATAASKDKVKGLRRVTLYEITDHRALLHWIAKHDREAITAFLDEYARRNHRQMHADAIIPDGMRVWQDREAF